MNLTKRLNSFIRKHHSNPYFRTVLIIAVLVCATSVSGVIIFTAMIALQQHGFLPSSSVVNNAILSSLVYITTIAIIFSPMVKFKKIKAETIGIEKKFKISYLWKAIVAFFCYLGVMTIITVIFSLIGYCELLNGEQQIPYATNINYEAGQIVIMFLALVVMPAVCEEILFRGFLFGELMRQVNKTRFKKWTPIIAGFLTSLVFALFHSPISVSIDVFALSIVLCYLRQETGNIYTGILVHMTKNALAFAILFGIIKLGF